MEFWGVEVKPGVPHKCEPGSNKCVHLSQASLGELKKDKDSEPIHIYVTIGDQKLVLGTLALQKCPQMSFDLVFEKEFELSHNWKNGSIYFCGYKAVIPDDSDEFYDSETDSEEFPIKSSKNEIKSEERGDGPFKFYKTKNHGDDGDSDDEDDFNKEESDKDIPDKDDSDKNDDEESSGEEEETPIENKKSKKRRRESVTQANGSHKKAKEITQFGSQKTDVDAKKGQDATAHPSKQETKTPVNRSKKPLTPKYGAQEVSCKSCNKTFGSEMALQSHSKAKHGASR